MEKKILRTFRFLNSLFFEARFIYDDPKPRPRVAEGESERVDQSGGEDLPGLDLESKKARKKIETKKEEEKFKGELERDKLKKEGNLPDETPKKEVELPVAPAIPIEEFLKRDLVKQHSELDRWSINIRRDQTKINADTWDHSTIDGLKRIYQECDDLGIFDENQGGKYYETVFAVLRGAADDNNPYLGDGDVAYAPMFKNPIDGPGGARQTISGLPPKGPFHGGEAFIRAYDSFVFLKAKVLIRQDKAQLDTWDARKKMDEDPIGTTVVDFGKRNIAVIQQAMKERDYATLAVYGVGAYALWQTLGKKLFGGGHHEGEAGKHPGIDFKKWVLIGAAVYGADKMLKNAGYDVLKMAGFKDMNAEVKGTPLESMKNILDQHNYEEYKDFDYGVALRMNERSLVSLQELLLRANDSGIHVIQPNLFPNEFPDLRGFTAMKDEKGINDNKHSAGQREANRVGKQLYLLAKAMGIVYDNTLHTHHKRFKTMSYDEALKDPVLQNSNIMFMLEAAGQFAPERAPGGLFSARKLQEEEDKLREGTGKVLGNNGFDLVAELQPGSGHFSGFLKGFPVVVVVAKDGYQVFLRNRYGKSYNAVPGVADATIPLEGPAMERGAQDAVKKVDERMEELVKKLQDGNKSIKGVKYENGKWVAITEFKGAADLDVAPDDVPTVINVAEFGQNLTLSDGETSSEKYLERNVLGRLVGQPDFHALRLFGAANRLSIEKNASSGAGVFTLLIGKNKQIRVDISYATATGFSFKTPTDEKKLLAKGSGFSSELGEVLLEDEKIKTSVDRLKLLIDQADESYIRQFFKSLPKWFTSATWANVIRGIELKDITGSVAKNYTKGLIDSQVSFLVSKMSNSADGMEKLSDVSSLYGAVVVPAVQQFDKIGDKFSAASTKKVQVGDDWGEGEFNDTVFNEIAGVGIKNADYKYWYSQFVQEIFAGKYGMDDIRKGNSFKARDIIKVFSYYTAIVDKEDITGANLGPDPTVENLNYIKLINAAKTILIGKGMSSPTNAQIRDEVNRTFYGGVAVFTLDDGEIARLQKLEVDYARKEKHLKAAKYVQYVAGQIYKKYNDGSLASASMIPSPESGQFWDIVPFDRFAPSLTSTHEFIDTRERVKMTRDYTTLDIYLKMNTAQRAGVDKKMVILPRADYVFTFALDAAGKPVDTDGWDVASGLLADRDTAGKIQNMKKTEAEELFEKGFERLRKKLEEEFKGALVVPKIDELQGRYRISGTAVMDDTQPDKLTFDYKFDQVDAVGMARPVDKDVVEDVKRMDKLFDGSDRTVTRGQQLAYIADRLEEVFRHQIQSSEGKSVYVDRDTLPEKIKRFFKDIKLWLFDDV